ncbi:MAG: hypothetical protein ACK42Z_09895 [Candidatus Kapaibacteriota bacterium]
MKLITVLVVFLLAVYSLSCSPFYLFLGGSNIIPTGKFKEIDKTSLGFHISFQERSFCNLWYGFRIDVSKLDSLESVPINTNYFDSYLLFSPEIRYVFLLSGNNKYDDTFYFFFQGLFHLSSITRKQEIDESNLGLGASLGTGVGFCFKLFKTCWAIEIDGKYSAPNFILKSKQRPSLTNYNFSLTLGVNL